MAAKKKYRVLGTRPIRHDGVDKVTGDARYGADIHLPGMLHGKVLRSPHAHARIVSIDTSKAEAHPAVRSVITGADLPGAADKPSHGPIHNILAGDKALYHGHPIAAVAATNVHDAEEALDLIEVVYDVLDPVMDVREAMKEGSALLHDSLRTSGLGEASDEASNISQHFRHEHGDLDVGFAASDYVIEREFTTAMVHQGYIEPQNATAHVTPDGRVTVWCSTQAAFGVREEVSDICGIPLSNIKVVPMEIGGGFGGKLFVVLEPLAVCLSSKSGKPVKMTMTRAEVLQATGPTSGSHVKVRMGAKANGKLTAADVTLAYEAGAYAGSPVSMAAMCVLAPYLLEHVRIDGYDVVVNRPKAGAYRAPGATNAAFASESVIDELAGMCGMDGVEFRLLNAVKEGDRRADGPVFARIGFVETLQAALDSEHWQTPLGESDDPSLSRGRGIASGFWFNIAGNASATLTVNADGKLTLVEGSVDIGGSRTTMAMIVAEVLGLEAEDVHPIVGDTDAIGYTDFTGGSSTTHKMGWVCHEAALVIKGEVVERAAKMLEVDSSEVTYHDDATLTAASKPDKKLTFADVAAAANGTGGPITAEHSKNSGGAGPGFGTHVVDVEVDIETGKVSILRFTAIQDVGHALHPSYVEGQLQGGAVQGIGWALNEEYFYDEKGLLANASYLDYRVPTTLDVPMVEAILVEVPNPTHPYGVRGVGETPIIPPVAAIGNAIAAATGKRMFHTPMNPAYIMTRVLN
jgi:xanthine dehydrogenase molybdenum-binding subunit